MQNASLVNEYGAVLSAPIQKGLVGYVSWDAGMVVIIIL